MNLALISTAAFFALFAVTWTATFAFCAHLGGWQTLAGSYRAEGPVEGTVFRFRNAAFRRWMNYGNCLTFTVNREGLGIAMLPLFRFAHPALFVPWADVTSSRHMLLGMFEVVDLQFAQQPSVPVRISKRLADKIAHAVRKLRVDQSVVARSLPAWTAEPPLPTSS